MLERPTAIPVTIIPEAGELAAEDRATPAFEEPLPGGEEANGGTGADRCALRVRDGEAGPADGCAGARPPDADGLAVAGEDVAAGSGCAVFVSPVEGSP